jgi:hypothetical protein
MNHRLNIAYLTTAYPSVSHTFIRRELLEIERRGHLVWRLSIRPSGAPIVNGLDREEAKKTFYCLDQPIALHAARVIQTAILMPVQFFRACYNIGQSVSLQPGFLCAFCS